MNYENLYKDYLKKNLDLDFITKRNMLRDAGKKYKLSEDDRKFLKKYDPVSRRRLIYNDLKTNINGNPSFNGNYITLTLEQAKQYKKNNKSSSDPFQEYEYFYDKQKRVYFIDSTKPKEQLELPKKTHWKNGKKIVGVPDWLDDHIKERKEKQLIKDSRPIKYLTYEEFYSLREEDKDPSVEYILSLDSIEKKFDEYKKSRHKQY